MERQARSLTISGPDNTLCHGETGPISDHIRSFQHFMSWRDRPDLWPYQVLSTLYVMERQARSLTISGPVSTRNTLRHGEAGQISDHIRSCQHFTSWRDRLDLWPYQVLSTLYVMERQARSLTISGPVNTLCHGETCQISDYIRSCQHFMSWRDRPDLWPYQVPSTLGTLYVMERQARSLTISGPVNTVCHGETSQISDHIRSFQHFMSWRDNPDLWLYQVLSTLYVMERQARSLTISGPVNTRNTLRHGETGPISDHIRSCQHFMSWRDKPDLRPYQVPSTLRTLYVMERQARYLTISGLVNTRDTLRHGETGSISDHIRSCQHFTSWRDRPDVWPYQVLPTIYVMERQARSLTMSDPVSTTNTLRHEETIKSSKSSCKAWPMWKVNLRSNE